MHYLYPLLILLVLPFYIPLLIFAFIYYRIKLSKFNCIDCDNQFGLIAGFTSRKIYTCEKPSFGQRFLLPAIRRIKCFKCKKLFSASPYENTVGENWYYDPVEEERLSKIQQLKYENEERQKEEDAIKRGVLSANVNKHGAITCPYCNISFEIKYESIFKDNIHLECRTRIKLIPYRPN